jgi:hypothetical protein
MRYREFKKNFRKLYPEVPCLGGSNLVYNSSTWKGAFDDCNNANYLWNMVRVFATDEEFAEFVKEIQPLVLAAYKSEVYFFNRWDDSGLAWVENSPEIVAACKKYYPARLRKGLI